MYIYIPVPRVMKSKAENSKDRNTRIRINL